MQTKNDLTHHVFDDVALAKKPAAQTTRDDLRRVVARLNSKVETQNIEGSTARKIWGKLRAMYRDMYSHDLDDLRIREDDASIGVKPPRKGKDREKEALEPNEAAQLLWCKDVPLEARRMWAAYLYLGCRDGEMKALSWDGVRLARRELRIHESIDRDAEEEGATKETKTGTERRIDIPPPLVPMLSRQCTARAEASGSSS